MTSFYYYDHSFRGFFFLCKLNLSGITKFKYERKNEKDSGRSSKYQMQTESKTFMRLWREADLFCY